MNSAICVITTSVKEGFGFSFLEPWTAGRTVIGRRIDYVCKDFEEAGVRFDKLYSEIKIPLVYISTPVLRKKMEHALDDIYRAWVENGIFSPLIDGFRQQEGSAPKNPEAWKKLREFMKHSWEVMHKTHYCRDHNFIENGQVPDHMEKAFEWMVDIHGQDDWTPGFSKMLDRTDENLSIIFEEKEWALREVKKLPEILDVESLGLSKEMEDHLKIILRLYEHFVMMAKLSTSSVFLAQKAIESKDKGDAQRALDTLPALYDYAKVVEKEFEGSHYPHYIYGHLEPSRMITLAREIESKLPERS
jgi:hypothetical protein